MAKESFYFSHDYGARNDPKLIKVLMRLGQAGKGIYWDLIEMLYEEGGYLSIEEIESYAFALRTDCETINRLINEFDLFEKNESNFWSISILNRLDRRDDKSKKASESAKTRWIKANAVKKDAIASVNECERNAIKKSKVNKSKVNKSKEETRVDLIDFEKEKKISEASLIILKDFKFSEIKNPNQLMKIGSFVRMLFLNNQFEDFREQYPAYWKYKKATASIPQSLDTFISDGWQRENWIEKLKQHGESKQSTQQGKQQSVDELRQEARRIIADHKP